MVMNWFTKKLYLLQNMPHREHYSARDIYREARKILVDQNTFEKAEKELSEEAKASVKKLIKGRVLKGEITVEEALRDVIRSLHHLSVDTVGIFHLVMNNLRELIIKDEAIREQVGEVIVVLEEKAKQELAEIDKVALDTANGLESLSGSGSAFGWIQQKKDIVASKAHRKHFQAREMYHESLELVKTENRLDHALTKFRAGLEKHILDNVKEGEQSALEAIEGITHELRRIGADAVVIFHFFIEGIRELVKEDKELESKIPEIKKFEAEAEKEFMEIVKLAHDAGGALRSIAATG